MKPKLMTAQYPGKCRKCKGRFIAGSPIYWSKETGAFHSSCYESDGGNGKGQEQSKAKTPPPPPKIKTDPKQTDEYFTVDWSELRQYLTRAMDGDFSWLTRNANQGYAKSHTLDVNSWHGFTANQLRDWLKNGYKAQAIQNLGDFTPPIRDKRSYIYAEEGEEIHVDRVLSGEDNYMGQWTKRERIPGVAVEAKIMFSAGVKAEIVNAYNAWICRAVYALESAGIDCQVTLKFSSREAHIGGPAFPHSIVRVKQENENTDFFSFSPMLSPAALRSFGFCAMILHADRYGRDITSGHGHGRSATEWEVLWDNERRVLTISCPYLSTTSFPEEKMTEKLREALQAMKGNS